MTGLESRKKYYWRVRATTSLDSSDWTPEWSFTVSAPTAAEEISDGVQSDFRLSQNFPNPFNPSTTIEFSLPKSSYVKVLIYNTLGHLIHTLVDETLRPGIYRKPWVATGVASGVYFYRIQADGFVETKRLVLVK